MLGQLHRKEKNCMKTMTFDFDNVGGLSHLYLIEASKVTAINKNVNDGRVVPVFSGTVYNIIVYGSGFAFEENMSLTDQGNIFDVKIDGFIPRLENIIDIATLEKGQWIAIHQDSNGNVLLSGTRDIPLRFISKKSTQRNVTAFSLAAKESHPSLVVESGLLVLE